MSQVKSNPFARGPSQKTSNKGNTRSQADASRENVKKQLLLSLEAKVDSTVENLKFSSEEITLKIEDIIFGQSDNKSQSKTYRDKIRKIELRLKGNRNKYIRDMLKQGVIDINDFCLLDEKTLSDDNYFKNIYNKENNIGEVVESKDKKNKVNKPPALARFPIPKPTLPKREVIEKPPIEDDVDNNNNNIELNNNKPIESSDSIDKNTITSNTNEDKDNNNMPNPLKKVTKPPAFGNSKMRPPMIKAPVKPKIPAFNNRSIENISEDKEETTNKEPINNNNENINTTQENNNINLEQENPTLNLNLGETNDENITNTISFKNNVPLQPKEEIPEKKSQENEIGRSEPEQESKTVPISFFENSISKSQNLSKLELLQQKIKEKKKGHKQPKTARNNQNNNNNSLRETNKGSSTQREINETVDNKEQPKPLVTEIIKEEPKTESIKNEIKPEQKEQQQEKENKKEEIIEAKVKNEEENKADDKQNKKIENPLTTTKEKKEKEVNLFSDKKIEENHNENLFTDNRNEVKKEDNKENPLDKKLRAKPKIQKVNPNEKQKTKIQPTNIDLFSQPENKEILTSSVPKQEPMEMPKNQPTSSIPKENNTQQQTQEKVHHTGLPLSPNQGHRNTRGNIDNNETEKVLKNNLFASQKLETLNDLNNNSRLDYSIMSNLTFKDKYKQLNESKISLETEIEVVKRENASYQKEIAILKKTIEELRSKNSSSNIELLKIELLKVKQENKFKIKECNELKEENTKLQDQIKFYEEHLNSVQLDKKTFREETEKRFSAYQKEIDSLRKEMSEKQSVLDDLRNKLNQKEMYNNRRISEFKKNKEETPNPANYEDKNEELLNNEEEEEEQPQIVNQNNGISLSRQNQNPNQNELYMNGNRFDETFNRNGYQNEQNIENNEDEEESVNKNQQPPSEMKSNNSEEDDEENPSSKLNKENSSNEKLNESQNSNKEEEPKDLFDKKEDNEDLFNNDKENNVDDANQLFEQEEEPLKESKKETNSAFVIKSDSIKDNKDDNIEKEPKEEEEKKTNQIMMSKKEETISNTNVPIKKPPFKPKFNPKFNKINNSNTNTNNNINNKNNIKQNKPENNHNATDLFEENYFNISGSLFDIGNNNKENNNKAEDLFEKKTEKTNTANISNIPPKNKLKFNPNKNTNDNTKLFTKPLPVNKPQLANNSNPFTVNNNKNTNDIFGEENNEEDDLFGPSEKPVQNSQPSNTNKMSNMNSNDNDDIFGGTNQEGKGNSLFD